MVVAANTRAKNATAVQNRRSVPHQPAIRSVATTEVVHPLTMLTAQAATAVRALDSPDEAEEMPDGAARRPVPAGPGDAVTGLSRVVSGGVIVGSGPVGARRMIRVRDSEGS